MSDLYQRIGQATYIITPELSHAVYEAIADHPTTLEAQRHAAKALLDEPDMDMLAKVIAIAIGQGIIIGFSFHAADFLPPAGPDLNITDDFDHDLWSSALQEGD